MKAEVTKKWTFLSLYLSITSFKEAPKDQGTLGKTSIGSGEGLEGQQSPLWGFFDVKKQLTNLFFSRKNQPR